MLEFITSLDNLNVLGLILTTTYGIFLGLGNLIRRVFCVVTGRNPIQNTLGQMVDRLFVSSATYFYYLYYTA